MLSLCNRRNLRDLEITTTQGLLLPYGTHEMPQRGHMPDK
jgi:hypothetical protein